MINFSILLIPNDVKPARRMQQNLCIGLVVQWCDIKILTVEIEDE